MVKRNHRDDYNHIYKKLRKLEKKLKRKRHDSSSSTDDANNNDSVASPTNIEDGPLPELESIYQGEEGPLSNKINNDEDCFTPTNCQTTRSERERSPAPPPVETTSFTQIASTSSALQTSSQTEGEVLSIDNTILELLGENPSTTKLYGKEINPDLAVRLEHIVTNGMSTDTRKELHKKYLPPSNCRLVDAPTLNPEIKAAISEVVLKRDKGIEQKQKQLGCAITCIGEAVTVLLKEENKNSEVIRMLMDANRMICDSHNSDSVTRRNFVLFNLKKDMRDQIQNSKIDNLLFGSDLSEALRTAKFISKSGAELKQVLSPRPPATRFTNKTPTAIPQRNLNWKAPPLNRRQKGTQEMKGPVQRNQHASSSRPSYRVPPPKNQNHNRH